MVLVLGISLIECRDPFLGSRDDILRFESRQGDSSPMACSVFGRLQQVQQFLNWFARDLCRFTQFPRLMGHSINSTMNSIAAWIAKIMLHMADNRVLPIDEIH